MTVGVAGVAVGGGPAPSAAGHTPAAVAIVSVTPVAAQPDVRWRTRLSLSLCALAMGASVFAARVVYERADLSNGLPWVRPVDVYHLFIDDRPVPITVTAGWERIPRVTTADALRTDPVLWRQLFTQDWDTVPAPLRAQGLDAMLERYRSVLFSPSTWDQMTAADWDVVPHPVRALAFRHMVQVLGRVLPRRRAAWPESFDCGADADGHHHVGVVVRSSGRPRERLGESRPRAGPGVRFRPPTDAGLVRHCRDGHQARRRRLLRPWRATRFVAIWVSSLLDATGGDLEAAVRAYHRGVRRALEGDGDDYARAVFRRAEEYLRGGGPSPSWRYIFYRDREITRVSWPWLRARRVLGARPHDATAALDRPNDPVPTWWRLALEPAPRFHE